MTEVGGLANFPNGRKFLMEEYFNRGDLNKALNHAVLLLRNENYGPLAAAIVIQSEKWLKVSADKSISIPERLLSKKVKLNGKEISISSLKSIEKKSSLTGPGKLIGSLQLADLEAKALSSYPESHYKTILRLPRQPHELTYVEGDWLTSSPFSMLSYNSSRKLNWEKRGLLKSSSKEISTPKVSKGNFINGIYFNLEYPQEGNFLEIAARNKAGETLWRSSHLSDYDQWEPVSAPYNKFDTTVVMLLEKQRTAAPVSAIGFIDYQTGKIRRVVQISGIRDPFQRHNKSDIGGVVQFHDRFTEDRNSVYMFTGSGEVIKINALHQRIDWIQGYNYRVAGRRDDYSLSWYRVAASAPSYIGETKGKVINFEASRMGWFCLSKIDGKVLWRNFLETPNYIHSRGSKQIIFSSKTSNGPHHLIKLSTEDGSVLWRQELFGLQVTGEGIVSGDTVFIPIEKGLIQVDSETGKVKNLQHMNETALKIRHQENKWILYGLRNAFLFEDGKDLKGSLVEKYNESPLPNQPQVNWDRKYVQLESVIDFPFTDFRYSGLPKVYHTSKPGYFILTKRRTSPCSRKAD